MMDTTLLSRNWETTSFSTIPPSEMLADGLRPVGILAGHHAALGNGIDLSVGRLQVRLQEYPAVQVPRVPEAGDGDVDTVARASEGGQLRVHHDHRGVPAAHILRCNGEPEACDQ